MLLDFIIIALSPIPISTAVPRKVLHTHIFYTFFGPFFGAPGAFALYFRIPFSRYVSPYFSDVSTTFLNSFFTGLRLLMIIETPDDRGQSPCLA